METITILVREVINHVSTINVKNAHRYKDIKKALEEHSEYEQVILDFEQVYLEGPEENQDFLDILSDSKVIIRLHNSDELYKTLQFVVLLSNLPENKVENVIEEIFYDVPKVEAKDTKIFDLINSTYSLVNEVGVIDLMSRVSVINRDTYVDAIKEVIEYHSCETKSFELDITDMSVDDDQLDSLSQVISELIGDGIEFRLISDNDEVNKIVETCINLGRSRGLTVASRIKMLDDYFDTGTVGMLTTYVKGGGRDMFGRKGGGKPVTTLPAIYIRHDDEFAYFDVFKGRTFCRKFEYEMQNDGDSHPGIIHSEKKVKIQEIGLCAICVGSAYHFNLPIQSDESGMQKIYEYDGDGELMSKKVTMPEFIKEVLDDWEINYNRNELDASIKVSKQNMSL